LIGLRVAPSPRSLRLGRVRISELPRSCAFRPRRRPSFGFPRTFSPLAVPAMDHRVSSNLASSTPLALPLRVAPARALPTAPMTSPRVSPSPASFRLCQRWIFEFPRVSHLSAYLVVNLRVSPNPRSSRCADDESPGIPGSCILWLCRQCVFEFPRVSHPSAGPAAKPRVSPKLRATGLAFDQFPSIPESWIFRQVPAMDFRVSTNLASIGDSG